MMAARAAAGSDRVKSIKEHINYNLYGKKPLPRYDWISDPKGLKQAGHIPKNRCYYCGNRFLDSAYSAFCNICDDNMSPDNDQELLYVVTVNDKERKSHEGYWTTRRQLIKNRIRIPDDIINEKEYERKLKIIQDQERKKNNIFSPEFKKASE